MTTELEGVLRRIKKCLALRGSPNPHEAATALAMAQKLMAAHNISEAGLLDSEIKQADAEVDAISRLPVWQNVLASQIARVFGCKLYALPGWCLWEDRSAHRLLRLRFLGAGGRAEAAAYAFDVVCRAARRAKEKFLDAEDYRGLHRSTIRAASNTFLEQFVRIAMRSVESATLEPAMTAALEARLVKELGDDPQTTKSPKAGYDEAAALAGLSAGSEFKFHSGVGAAEGQPRLANGSQA